MYNLKSGDYGEMNLGLLLAVAGGFLLALLPILSRLRKQETEELSSNWPATHYVKDTRRNLSRILPSPEQVREFFYNHYLDPAYPTDRKVMEYLHVSLNKSLWAGAWKPVPGGLQITLEENPLGSPLHALDELAALIDLAGYVGDVVVNRKEIEQGILKQQRNDGLFGGLGVDYKPQDTYWAIVSLRGLNSSLSNPKLKKTIHRLLKQHRSDGGIIPLKASKELDTGLRVARISVFSLLMLAESIPYPKALKKWVLSQQWEDGTFVSHEFRQVVPGAVTLLHETTSACEILKALGEEIPRKEELIQSVHKWVRRDGEIIAPAVSGTNPSPDEVKAAIEAGQFTYISGGFGAYDFYTLAILLSILGEKPTFEKALKTKVASLEDPRQTGGFRAFSLATRGDPGATRAVIFGAQLLGWQ